MAVAIKVEGLSKAYQIGQIGTGTISRDLERWWITKIKRNEDPFLKIGETNDRSTKGESDIVWSLKDINFEIQQGDAVGIIGRNGAGKSTLLKILSEVTSPTTGKINIRGRVASLLEVGTGFHPELTGKENIFLNGAILGMRKKEIQRKLDEIIDFSGVERYVDTPVKRYSSGMYVRLAFAVAAHLESEIMIVDEVLAVGDAEFQKKCLGKMNDVSKGQGRTVLFVSHNIGAVKNLCNRGILLENGMIKTLGEIDDVIGSYFKKDENGEGQFISGKLHSSEKIFIKSLILKNQRNEVTELFNVGDNITIDLELFADENIVKPNIGIGIKTKYGTVTAANTMLDGSNTNNLNKGLNKLSLTFKNVPLLPQEYYLGIGMREQDCKTFLMTTKDIGYFSITTNMKDLGIDNPFADELAMDSVSPFVPYEWDFGNGNIQSFNILNNVRK